MTDENRILSKRIGLVHAVAKRYTGYGVPIADLCQEGFFGLREAMRRHNPAKGSFSTYAHFWIRRSMQDILFRQCRPVTITAFFWREASKARRAYNELAQEIQAQPTARQISNRLEVSEAEVESLLPGTDARLDQPVREDGTTGLELLTADAAAPDEIAELKQIIRAVRAAVERLPTRDADIVRRHYGMHGEEPETLQEIGDRYGLSRERVRQIIGRACKRLRHSFTAYQRKAPHAPGD